MKTKAIITIMLMLFLASMLSTAFSRVAMTHTEEDPYTKTLYAGQHIDVGTVAVWNDGEYLYVKYCTTGDWVMIETHLAVATSLGGIPQTKKGNPIPGKFPYSEEHDPPVTEYTYKIPLDWDACTELYIATHAEVEKPSEQRETAWGDGYDFPGRNWATYFTYHVQPFEIIWPEGGIATVAFEDLPMGEENDYDYNDFVTDVSVVGVYSLAGLIELNFTFDAQARGAEYHHDLNLRIPADTFGSGGDYIIEYYEINGTFIGSTSGSFNNTADLNLTIFANTWDALPPNNPPDFVGNALDGSGWQPGRRTVVVLEFTTPFPFNLTAYSPEYVGVHGDNLFFDPYLYVWDTDQEVHITDPRFIVVPTDWEWPQEGAPIWTVYPYNATTGEGVTAGNPPDFTTYWYTETPTDDKWTP